MPLLPESQALLDLRAAAGGLPVECLSVPEARATVLRLIALQGEPEPVAEARDLEAPGPAGSLRMRLYRPMRQTDGLAPVIVYFHGGGWVLGDLDLVDRPCRSLANATGALVVSADYRLAPEHPYPAALDDAQAAVRWVAEQAKALGADLGRLVVAGDSAGASLAAAVCLLERDAGGSAIAAQALIYPVTDFDFTRGSYRAHAEGLMLGRASMQWFWAHHLGPTSIEDAPLARPLRAASHAGLPPAFVALAEFDPLRDEGEAYARALGDAGTQVDLREYPGLMHGFFWTLGFTPSGKAMLSDIAQALRGFGVLDA